MDINRQSPESALQTLKRHNLSQFQELVGFFGELVESFKLLVRREVKIAYNVDHAVMWLGGAIDMLRRRLITLELTIPSFGRGALASCVGREGSIRLAKNGILQKPLPTPSLGRESHSPRIIVVQIDVETQLCVSAKNIKTKQAMNYHRLFYKSRLIFNY